MRNLQDQVKKSILLPKIVLTFHCLNHEYFRACLVMFTAPNWHTLGIMVITQFNHIIAFF